MGTVLDHMTVLEATGMVDFSDTEAIPLALVAAPSSAAPTPPRPAQVVAQDVPQQRQPEDGIPDRLLGLGALAVVARGLWFWSGGRGSRRMHP